MDDAEVLNVVDISMLPKLSIRGNIAPKGFAMFENEESFCAADCSRFLQDNADAKKIVVEISSPGGFVSEGFEIFDLLKGCGKEVITIGYSVNSIAVVIFLAGKKRYLSENAQFIIHLSRIDPQMLGSALTSADLSRLAEETNQIDMKIMDLYCSVLGEDNRSKILAYMGVETDLGAKGAIKLGFANGYWAKNSEAKTAKNLCVTDYAINLINNMETKKIDALESAVNKLTGLVKNLFMKQKNDITLELKDGAKVYVYTETEDLVGKDVVTVDADGIPTTEKPLDGEHELADGRVIVVADGKVTEVKETTDIEDLKNQLASAKAETAAVQAKLDAQATANAELATQVKNVVKEFNEFKKQVPGDKGGKGGDGKTKIEAADIAKMSASQRLLAIRQGKI